MKLPDRCGRKAFVLLDSPFREIHAVRLAADGTIYAAAVNGSQGGESRATRSARRAEPSRAPVPSVSTEITAIAVDRQRPVSVDAGTARGRGRRGAAPRGDLSHPARRPLGHAVGVRRGCALRPADRAVGQPARRHRHRRQDLPRQRRSGARDAARARDGAAGHGSPSRAVRPHRRRHQQSRQALRAVADARARRGTYESDVRDAGTVASWGVIRWRASARARRGRPSSRAPATPRRRTKPGARGRRPTPTPTASRSPARTRATCSGARCWPPGSARGRRSSPRSRPPICPATCGPRCPAITVHPPGTVFQRPFSTGELEIAGFEDNTSDGRAQSQPARPARRRPSGAAPALGRRIYQKGLQTFVWKADDENDDRLQYDVFVSPRRRNRLEAAASAACGIRSSCGTRRRCPTAPTSSRSRRPTRRRTPRRRRWSASSRA